MCRLLGYVGKPIRLDWLLFKPKHSLIVQSYNPQEMTSGLLNADGFGIGWHHPEREDLPYIYKNPLPIWADSNLSEIARCIETDSILGYVRSATPGSSIDISNCQPFRQEKLTFVHNGFIENFRQTLYRPIRNLLSDKYYQSIKGSTDSEHIWALINTHLENDASLDLAAALRRTLIQITEMAQKYESSFSANTIISNGDRMIVSRYSDRTQTPTLYWIKDSLAFPDSVIIASEPMFEGDWKPCADNSMMVVSSDLEISFSEISKPDEG